MVKVLSVVIVLLVVGTVLGLLVYGAKQLFKVYHRRHEHKLRVAELEKQQEYELLRENLEPELHREVTRNTRIRL